MLIVLALPSTKGAAVITGTGWRRGGGPATWTRWSMARASASTLDGARGLNARIVLITPPPGHYEPGAVGLHRRLPRQAPTSGVGPDGGLANKPHKEPRGAPGDWHLKLKVSRSLASCSLLFDSAKTSPGNARGIWRAISRRLRFGAAWFKPRRLPGGNPTHGNGNDEVGLHLRRRQGRGRIGDARAPRRQGREPRRDGQSRPAGAARLHHHDRGLNLLLRPRPHLSARAEGGGRTSPR